MTYAFRYEPAGTLFCGCCLRHTANLRTDRKGRPYITCSACRSRTFVYSDEGLRGIRVMSAAALDRLAAMKDAISRDARHLEYERTAEAQLQAAGGEHG